MRAEAEDCGDLQHVVGLDPYCLQCIEKYKDRYDNFECPSHERRLLELTIIIAFVLFM